MEQRAHGGHGVEGEEKERQMIVLALAMLAEERPGWEDAIVGIVGKLEGQAMWEVFRGERSWGRG